MRFGNITMSIRKKIGLSESRWNYDAARKDLEIKIETAKGFKGSEDERKAVFEAAYTAGVNFITSAMKTENDDANYARVEQLNLEALVEAFGNKFRELDAIRPAEVKEFAYYVYEAIKK